MIRLLVLFSLAALALAAPASAATVFLGAPNADEYLEGPFLYVIAAPGDEDDVQMTTSAGGARTVVSDASAPVTAGRGCVRIDAHTARCTTSRDRPIDAGVIHLGDGDDTAHVKIPRAADWGDLQVDGGAGADVLDVSGAVRIRGPHGE